MDQVMMEVPAVRKMAERFGQISEVLNNVAKMLDMLLNLLKSTAFIGEVGGAAVIQFLEVVKPQIEKMAQKCAELDKDLGASVDAYERGDQMGATRFY